jgi:hypothetical protein
MDSTKPSFSAKRRWLIWFNTIVGVVAVLAIIAMANYLASGYFKRFQVGANSATALSPQTISLLQRTNKIDVTIFFDQQGDEEIYSLVSALLKQYSYADPNITIQTIDYTRSPGKAAALLARYKLSNLKDKNFVVFDSGGKSKIILGNELYDYDINSILSGQSKTVRRNAFKGELLFSSAIFAVTDPHQAKAYFVFGQGENDPENLQDHGYSKFASILKDEANVDWEKISLAARDIPDDCQLLIVAGPSKARFSDAELAKMEAYLKQGRRMLVLLNNSANGADSGIEKVLAKWNVAVTAYALEDPRFTLDGTDLIPAQVNGEHPIFKAIASEGLQIYLVAPRIVFYKPQPASPTADVPQVETLAATSTNAVGRFKIYNAKGELEAHEQHGTFPLVLAVERGSIKNVNTERGVTRILVLGDSDCFDNQNIDTLANHFFANAAISWLTDRPQLLLAGIGPRPIKEYKLVLTKDQMQKLKWILLAGMPGAVLLFGGLVWMRRRS